LSCPKEKKFAPFPLSKGSGAIFTSKPEILRGDLAAILYRTTKKLADVKYDFDATIKTAASNDASSFKVELSNGETHEMTYSLRLMANGRR
jgi:pyruvate/2-oxoglutarate dehydrogenase complex dihydrolipoamide dehydrogenase (E3) component